MLKSSRHPVRSSLFIALNANFFSAGRRDSVLTNHGYQQATRLGLYFKSLGLKFTHIFSSHLQRAVTTASKIREAQLTTVGDCQNAKAVPDTVQLPVLMEKDFGSLEGKKFYDHHPEIKVLSKGQPHENKRKAGFVDGESKTSMARRADTFLDKYLMPLFEDSSSDDDTVIAIVSHGIFLSTLWKRILQRVPPRNTVLSNGLEGTVRQSLEHLGGWSNTGYLELYFTRVVAEHHSSTTEAGTVPITVPLKPFVEVSAAVESLHKPEILVSVEEITAPFDISVPLASTSHGMQGWSMSILRVNSKDHLQGLKRARGGLGSSRHDASQVSIKVFFKRRKIE